MKSCPGFGVQLKHESLETVVSLQHNDTMDHIMETFSSK